MIFSYKINSQDTKYINVYEFMSRIRTIWKYYWIHHIGKKNGVFIAKNDADWAAAK